VRLGDIEVKFLRWWVKWLLGAFFFGDYYSSLEKDGKFSELLSSIPHLSLVLVFLETNWVAIASQPGAISHKIRN